MERIDHSSGYRINVEKESNHCLGFLLLICDTHSMKPRQSLVKLHIIDLR
jgi:putative component of toxin-antitoxin plasmid stabilization module